RATDSWVPCLYRDGLPFGQGRSCGHDSSAVVAARVVADQVAQGVEVEFFLEGARRAAEGPAQRFVPGAQLCLSVQICGPGPSIQVTLDPEGDLRSGYTDGVGRSGLLVPPDGGTLGGVRRFRRARTVDPRLRWVAGLRLLARPAV